MIRSALIAAALGAAGIAPSMLSPGSGPAPVPAPGPAPVITTNATTNTAVFPTAQRVQVVVQAFDASGRAVPFEGTVTVADRSSFGTLPVKLRTQPSLLDLPLTYTGFWSSAPLGIQ
jgi:hypothetical protein